VNGIWNVQWPTFYKAWAQLGSTGVVETLGGGPSGGAQVIVDKWAVAPWCSFSFWGRRTHRGHRAQKQKEEAVSEHQEDPAHRLDLLPFPYTGAVGRGNAGVQEDDRHGSL
jgi:hypothetical protein